MMIAVTKRDATYADLVALPPNVVGEILGGELHVHPRPASPHARASSRLGSVLGPPFDIGDNGPGGWVILFEPELHLGEDVVVPDLAGWRRSRMPEVPDTVGFTLAPDWVCEVLSPSTARVDRTKKLEIYAREGVAHVWFVEPRLLTLEILRLEAGRWMIVGVHAENARLRAEPFEAIELDLSLLFAR